MAVTTLKSDAEGNAHTAAAPHTPIRTYISGIDSSCAAHNISHAHAPPRSSLLDSYAATFNEGFLILAGQLTNLSAQTAAQDSP